MNKNIIICNNCGKDGHHFYQCRLPITSCGIILFRYVSSQIEYLMIRRKDSYGFIDFVRGKYSSLNIYQITYIIDQMSLEEKHKLLNQTHEQLWKDMWGDTDINDSSNNNNEQIIACKKFNQIKNYGIKLKDKTYLLQDIIENSETIWNETEWEFPKGRRNINENDLTCALREFQEETGIHVQNIKIIENLLTFEETFIGTNHKSYKHKYFLAYTNNNDLPLDKYQKSEVGTIDWKTFDMCVDSIRPYNLEKKELLKNINSIIQEYRLYT
jgi:ADP-ribose pyrophosphatase YjhB (NUDIX family)